MTNFFVYLLSGNNTTRFKAYTKILSEKTKQSCICFFESEKISEKLLVVQDLFFAKTHTRVAEIFRTAPNTKPTLGVVFKSVHDLVGLLQCFDILGIQAFSNGGRPVSKFNANVGQWCFVFCFFNFRALLAIRHFGLWHRVTYTALYPPQDLRSTHFFYRINIYLSITCSYTLPQYFSGSY